VSTGPAAATIGWFRLSVEAPGLRRVLFESYGVFTPLQLMLAVAEFEYICQWSGTVKYERKTYETKHYPNHQPLDSALASTSRQRS
jgi:hypothetical protein